jgi:hypothetical protein
VPAFLLILAFYYLSGTGQDLSLPSDKAQANVPNQPHHDESKHTSPSKETTTHDGNDNPAVDSKTPTTTTSAAGHTQTKAPNADSHPIDTLISNAEKDFTAILGKQSYTLADAAAAYRKRRDRHPPPGFDQWFNFAKENNAIIVEDFWDQVYHDLEPFWALPAAQIRKTAWDYEMTINLRNHNATAGSDWFWTQIWLKLIKTIEHLLPDLDIALNAMDEPRLVVPWEDIDAYMAAAGKTRKLSDLSEIVTEFQSLPKPGDGPDKSVEVPDKKWEGTSAYHVSNPPQHQS